VAYFFGPPCLLFGDAEARICQQIAMGRTKQTQICDVSTSSRPMSL